MAGTRQEILKKIFSFLVFSPPSQEPHSSINGPRTRPLHWRRKEIFAKLCSYLHWRLLLRLPANSMATPSKENPTGPDSSSSSSDCHPTIAKDADEGRGAADDALTVRCHCGGIEIQLLSKPEKLNECRCTVCYAYGALWAYFPRREVSVTTRHGVAVQKYVRSGEGFGDLSFNRCSQCGCMTHWLGEGERDGPEKKMGVNCRMLPESAIEGVPRRVSYC